MPRRRSFGARMAVCRRIDGCRCALGLSRSRLIRPQSGDADRERAPRSRVANERHCWCTVVGFAHGRRRPLRNDVRGDAAGDGRGLRAAIGAGVPRLDAASAIGSAGCRRADDRPYVPPHHRRRSTPAEPRIRGSSICRHVVIGRAPSCNVGATPDPERTTRSRRGAMPCVPRTAERDQPVTSARVARSDLRPHTKLSRGREGSRGMSQLGRGVGRHRDQPQAGGAVGDGRRADRLGEHALL